MISQSNQITSTSEQGVSLIELLIGMAVGLFLLAGLLQVYLSSKHSYDVTENLARLQENGRYVSEVLVQDLRRAGYWGGNADVSSDSTAGTVGPEDPLLTCSVNTDWGRMVGQRIMGVDDNETDGSGDYSACIPGSYLRGDVLAVRYITPWAVAAADMENNRMYMRSSLFVGKIFTGSQEANADNDVPAPPSHTGELMGHIYYIGDSGRDCRGQDIPSLYRVSLNNAGTPSTVEEIASGVENLQLQYGVDTDGGDPSITRYFDADGLDLADWDDVIAARIWVLLRAECPETGFVNSNTYNMGDRAITPADGYRRQLYSSTVMLRNPNL